MNKRLLLALDRAASQPLSAIRDEAVLGMVRERSEELRRRVVDEHFRDAPIEVRAIMERAARDVRGEAGPLHGRLREALAGADLRDEVATEAMASLERLRAIDIDADLVQPDLPLALNPALHRDLDMGRLARLSDIVGLDDAKLEAMLDRGAGATNIDDALLAEFVDDGSVERGEADRFGLVTSVHRFVDGDADLTDRLLATRSDRLPEGVIKSTRDLAQLTAGDWKAVLEAGNVSSPGGLTRAEYAEVLVRRAEALFPTDAMLARMRPPDRAALRDDLTRVAVHFDGGFEAALDEAALEELDAEEAATLRAAHARLRGVSNRHPGFKLGAVLADAGHSVEERINRIERHVASLNTFLARNDGVELLNLDYSLDSTDVTELSFDGIAQAERQPIINTLKAYQRAYAVTSDVQHAAILLDHGFDSSSRIVLEGLDAFQMKTGFAENLALDYFKKAEARLGAAMSGVGAILDAVRADFKGPIVSNLSPAIADYFRKIDGYEDHFGSQSYCRCEECSSIIGAAAYFVDLMSFVEEHILSKVFTGARANHVLNLKVRRPDLWTLPLTCANINTEIPQLVVVAEIFEKYIARRSGFAGNLNDSLALEQFVYRDRIRTRVDSFQQPVLLPLAELDIYLRRFETTRGDIARTLDPAPGAVARATFGLSTESHDLITTSDATLATLRNLYGINFQVNGVTGKINAVDALDLLRPMGLTRDELGELIATRFVRGNLPSANAPLIQGQKTSPESVQNDIERVLNLTPDVLDRMHRFTRLRVATDWTTTELDLLLTHLKAAGLANGIDSTALIGLSRLAHIAAPLRASAEELCALFSTIPQHAAKPGASSLLDRQFNRQRFVQAGGALPDGGAEFIHPALDDDSGGAATSDALPRLMTALEVSENDHYHLILGLENALGIDIDGADNDARSFSLSLANLSLLFRHAFLARRLRLSVPELFQSIALAPGLAGDHVNSLDDLEAVMDFHAWVKASKFSLDDIAFITDGVMSADARVDDPIDLAIQVIDAINAEGALTFADTIFAFHPDIDDEQSRALVAANGAFLEGTTDGAFRIAADFDDATVIAIPAGVTVTVEDMRDMLLAHHAAGTIPTALASALRIAPEKLSAILEALDVDFFDPEMTLALHGEAPPDIIADLVTVVQPLATLFDHVAFDAEVIAFVRDEVALFGLVDLTSVSMTALRRLVFLRNLIQGLGARATVDDVAAVLGAFHQATAFESADQDILAAVIDADRGLVVSLQQAVELGAAAIPALEKLTHCAKVARHIGISGVALAHTLSNDYDDLRLAVDAVVTAFRAQFESEDEWKGVFAEYEQQALNLKRDALTNYLIHSIHPELESVADLYRYFLIDSEVNGCFTTSRVVAATNSLQLYVHRVMMNLEQDAAGNIHVKPDSVPADEWAWRQNYRVWQANRKVFLWPQNYIQASLLDIKTPQFEELESELLQQEINEQNVVDAYGKYIQEFQALANLEIAGSVHEFGDEGDVLHLFGVTAGDPPSFYYRTAQNLRQSEFDDSKGVVWGPWRSMDIKIPVRKIAPVVHNGQLHVFWVETSTSPQNKLSEGESRFLGYTHKLALRFSVLRLDGRWTAPQRISMYGAYPFSESDGVVDDPLAEPHEVAEFFAAIVNLTLFGIFGDGGGISSLSDLQKDLLTPRYDDEPHSKSRDGYTLTGFEWERFYPHSDGNKLMVQGAGYQLRGGLDLFRRVLTHSGSVLPASTGNASITINSSPPSPVLCEKGGIIHYGLPHVWAPFDDYAYASFVLHKDRIDRLTEGWIGTMRAHMTNGLYQGAGLLRVRRAWDIDIINGAETDAIIDANGDLFLLRGSVRNGANYLLQRLGTTLGETVARKLFEDGIDGLLDIQTQQTLKEKPLPAGMSIIASVENQVNTGRLDFTGPYGIYYREIFFYIPFLLAQSLNSQGKYREAQEWYHRIFDPTASEIIAPDPAKSDAENAARARDRVWRYLEFRDVGIQRLRDILTDPGAIETYKSDPFNPHAIARLRLSAYQQSVFMSYIENLLDWADDLFTQFQREQVLQATMIYMSVLDILGERPAALGDCGEGKIEPKSYENIVPHMKGDSEFLIEMEHWIVIKRLRKSKRKDKLKARFTLDAATIKSAAEMSLRAPALHYAGINNTKKSLAEIEIVDRGAGAGAARAAAVGMAVAVADGAAMEHRDNRVMFSGAINRAGAPARGGTPYHLALSVGNTVTYAVSGANVSATNRFATGVRIEKVDRAAGEPSAISNRPLIGSRWRKDWKLPDKLKGTLPRFGIGFIRQLNPIFCVPFNEQMLGYWDRVEDRLGKIRNCMDINGVRRSLSLFAPPIDPMMLVRARAAGLSIDDVMASMTGNLPPYRFTSLIERAKAFTATVQSFGASLLGALEKKDVEELTRLRNDQQQNLLRLGEKVREWELEASDANVESLERRKAGVIHRRAYYEGLLSGAQRNAWEIAQTTSRHLASASYMTTSVMEFVAGTLALMPQVGSPFAMKYGGVELKGSASRFASGLHALSTAAEAVAASAGLEAGFQRRAEGWRHQVDLANDELAQLESQIEAARLRRTMAERAITIHATTMEQTEEIERFLEDKFTGLALYSWLSTIAKRLHREAFNAAMSLARLAEQAYLYERNDDNPPMLDGNYWDPARFGLHAGSALLVDLQAFERRYIETNVRQREIDQPFSLTQIDPVALTRLKETGECEFTLGEFFFDLFYPGDFNRRIKSVRLTIPCITSSYTNVGATLTLVRSHIRREPQLGNDKLLESPSSRTRTIATSTAQNDSGLFELNFRDERYLPFEGAGAVSTWRLTLPKNFRQFDYQSINEVAIFVSYTADFDGALRDQVEALNGAAQGSLKQHLEDNSLGRVISLRQSLSAAFNGIIHSPAGTDVGFTIDRRFFPIYLSPDDLELRSAVLVLRPRAGQAIGALDIAINGNSVGALAPDPDFGGLPSANLGAHFAGGILDDHTIMVIDPGDLAPDAPIAGDPSAIDETRLEDLLLYLEYGLA